MISASRTTPSTTTEGGSYESGRLNLPFVGHTTFGKFPPVTEWTDLFKSTGPAANATFAVLGVPQDMGTQYRSGARFGPRGIREASTLYQFGHAEVYDFDTDETYHYRGVVDVGDADIVHTDMLESHRRTRLAVETIVEAKKIPIVLGGDHSITAPVCEALRKVAGVSAESPVFLLHIDAHLDFVDERHGVRYGHGNCMRRCLEQDYISRLLQLGIRGVSSTAREGFETARAMGSTILSVRQVRELGSQKIAEMIPSGASVYISIDIDGLDPSVAMGTGTPSHGGFLYYEVKDVLRAVVGKIGRTGGRVVGMDLVEVAPAYDPGGVTTTLAARIVLDAIGFVNLARDRAGMSTGTTGTTGTTGKDDSTRTSVTEL